MNSKLLLDHVTTYWDKPAPATTWKDPSSDDRVGPCLPGSLRFGVLKPIWLTRDKTQEHCNDWWTDDLDTDRMKAGIGGNQGHMKEDCLLFYKGFLNRDGH